MSGDVCDIDARTTSSPQVVGVLSRQLFIFLYFNHIVFAYYKIFVKNLTIRINKEKIAKLKDRYFSFIIYHGFLKSTTFFQTSFQLIFVLHIYYMQKKRILHTNF